MGVFSLFGPEGLSLDLSHINHDGSSPGWATVK